MPESIGTQKCPGKHGIISISFFVSPPNGEKKKKITKTKKNKNIFFMKPPKKIILYFQRTKTTSTQSSLFETSILYVYHKTNQKTTLPHHSQKMSKKFQQLYP